MEYEITLGQVISDVYKEKQLILQNSIPEDLEYKIFKEGGKNYLFAWSETEIQSITEKLQYQCKG